MITITPILQDRNESTRSWVYRSILDAIVHLDVKPTEMLDTGDLQAIFKASRTPIREAMIQLARDGFVELQPQRGSFVSPIDLDEVEKARFMRVCLEKEILVQACDLRDAGTLREMDYLLACQRDLIDGEDIRRQYQIDEKFHLAYYAVCKRENIWTHLRNSNLHYHRYKILNIPMQGMKLFTYTHHEDLFAALKDRDRPRVVTVIENHLNTDNWTGKDMLEKHPEWFVSSMNGAAVGAQSAI